MPRPFTPKVITANDLLEGDVIYFTAQDTWTRELSEAELITDEAEAQLRLIEAEKQNIKIVGAYLADAKAGPNGPEPTHFREEFRRTGPSNYFHGKQEADANV
jgi:exonuclease III